MCSPKGEQKWSMPPPGRDRFCSPTQEYDRDCFAFALGKVSWFI